MRVFGFLAKLALLVLVVCAFGCVKYSARIKVTNNTDSPHVVEFEGFGTHDFSAREVYLWTLNWEAKPTDSTKIEFDYFIDGQRCSTYSLWDGEKDRVLDLAGAVRFCGQ